MAIPSESRARLLDPGCLIHLPVPTWSSIQPHVSTGPLLSSQVSNLTYAVRVTNYERFRTLTRLFRMLDVSAVMEVYRPNTPK